jgi:hypothetical protein
MRRSAALLCACLAFAWAVPVAASPPAASSTSKPPRDRTSDALMATGGTVLCIGVVAQLVGFASWYHNATAYEDQLVFEPNLVPGVEIGIGLAFSIIGGAFLGVGIKHQQRWEARLANGTVRLQLRPTLGFGQVGLVGRF